MKAAEVRKGYAGYHFPEDVKALVEAVEVLEASSPTKTLKQVENVRNYLQMVQDDIGNDEGVREVARTALILFPETETDGKGGTKA